MIIAFFLNWTGSKNGLFFLNVIFLQICNGQTDGLSPFVLLELLFFFIWMCLNSDLRYNINRNKYLFQISPLFVFLFKPLKFIYFHCFFHVQNQNRLVPDTFRATTFKCNENQINYFFLKTSYTITNQHTKFNENLHTPMWTVLHDFLQDWVVKWNDRHFHKVYHTDISSSHNMKKRTTRRLKLVIYIYIYNIYIALFIFYYIYTFLLLLNELSQYYYWLVGVISYSRL